MIIIDLFDIDFHIFTVIKFLFNLVVRFNYICALNILLGELDEQPGMMNGEVKNLVV